MEWRGGLSILGAQGVKAEPCWMIPVEYKQSKQSLWTPILRTNKKEAAGVPRVQMAL